MKKKKHFIYFYIELIIGLISLIRSSDTAASCDKKCRLDPISFNFAAQGYHQRHPPVLFLGTTLFFPFLCFSSITVFVFVLVFFFFIFFPWSGLVQRWGAQLSPTLLFLRTLSLFLPCLVLYMSLSFSIFFPWFDIILICRLIWPCLHILLSRLGQVCSAGISPTATAPSPMVLF